MFQFYQVICIYSQCNWNQQNISTFLTLMIVCHKILGQDVQNYEHSKNRQSSKLSKTTFRTTNRQSVLVVRHSIGYHESSQLML